MEFTRLECRDIIAHINKTNVDSDVLAKLVTGANIQHTSINSGAMTTQGYVEAGSDFLPVVYTDAQLARIRVPDGNGSRPATQADVDEVNRARRAAHDSELRLRSTYKANLNERDVVNAAFDAPERDRGFNPQFERIAIGDKNSHGDVCVEIGGDGESIFRCAQGHGYTQSRSLRSCSHCFLAGVASDSGERSDPGALVGTDSRW